MSWFPTSGIASIAKTALREAQKTIDKALDIRDDDETINAINTPIDANSADFLGNWSKALPTTKVNEIENKKQLKLQASVWGSFSGSYFETKNEPQSPTIESLDDSIDQRDEQFSRSKLVVDSSCLPITQEEKYENNSRNNRLSIVSVDNSSESVELTTSPESEPVSNEPSSSSPKTRQISNSVEILVDSLTSPTSMEIIGFNQIFDEFASPLNSPMVDEVVQLPNNTLESIEVLLDEHDESIAEDTMSYTSISESTSATMLEQPFSYLKSQKMLKDTFNLTESDMLSNPETITRAPSRTRADLTNILINTNIIDIPTLELQVDDDGCQSDRTLKAMDSSSDTSIVEPNPDLKNLLAEAMTEKAPPENKSLTNLSQCSINTTQSIIILEKNTISHLDMTPRENSPNSSESRSDLVKIGSDHTSGHTSGDELETTTSSDIEIISSPNCDSSSTQSRQSPAKHFNLTPKCDDSSKKELLCKITMRKVKGHNRELSEASTISDDSELDRLVKRIAEITEILETRESKLIDTNRRNMELQELNASLQLQLDSFLTKQIELTDVGKVTEEYTQRMSSLETKFQQTIREKDTLKKQLIKCKQESASRMSKNELEVLIGEKDEIIKELREEGEKLSKIQLQHSNIIKKLRAKDKETESTLKNQKELIENITTETERLKRSLTAKEEVERTQIEAVHQLTSKTKKLESELSKIHSQHDDLTQKYETVKKSLDAAKRELVDKTRTSSELVARENKLETLKSEKRITDSQNAALYNELEDLREKMRQLDLDYIKKEKNLRRENSDLLKRLEDAEGRNEELSQSVLEVSKPLVRQLESLQVTHLLKMTQFEKVEEDLMMKNNELQTKLQMSQCAERSVKDESVVLRSKVSDLEFELSSIKHQAEMMKIKSEKSKTEIQIAEQQFKRQLNELKHKLKQENEQQEELLLQEHSTIQILTLKEALELEQKKPEAENYDQNLPRTNSNSPTLSLGKASVTESLNSFFWSQDEPFDIQQTPKYTNMFEIQMLQSNLKQRDGEAQQLQWELNRREQERSLLTTEISTLLTRVDDLEGLVKEHDNLKSKFNEIQQQYDTLCQLYGEKVEENDELKLDLLDVKEMYKAQINELLKQQRKNL